MRDRAAVRSGKKWGYIDKCGKLIVNPQFDGRVCSRTAWRW